MEALVQDNLYLVLIVIGAVVVSIHASTLFSTPVPDHSVGWTIDEFELQDLCGKRRFMAGYVAYLIPILLAYLLLAVSPELLTLSMGIAGTTASVGALTLSRSEAQSLAPILAATAIVALMGVSPLRRLERALRGVGHDIAGVPQHLQEIITCIQRQDLRALTPESTLTLENTPDKGLSAKRWSIPMFGNDIKAIQIYRDWLYGYRSADFWTGRSAQLLAEARPRMSREYELFMRKLAPKEARLASISSADSRSKEDDSVEHDRGDDEEQSVGQLARDLRARYTRLLAVAFINEQATRKHESTPDELWELVLDVRSSLAGSRLLGVLAAGTYAGFVISLVFATLFYLTVAVVTSMAPENSSLNPAGTQLLVNGMSMGRFYMSNVTAAFNAALWDVTGLCLIFLFGSGASLVFRASRVRHSDWSYWHEGGHPVVQYSIVALLATVCAAFAYVFFLFVKLVVWPAAVIHVPGHFASMLKDFGSSYVQFGFLCLLAAPCATLICLLSDRLEKRKAGFSADNAPTIVLIVCFAVVSGAVLPLLVRMQIDDLYHLEGVFLASVVPATTLLVLSFVFWFVGFSQITPVPDDATLSSIVQETAELQDVDRATTAEQTANDSLRPPSGAEVLADA